MGTLHEFACHPCARGHANLLCIVPILVYVAAKQLHVSIHQHDLYPEDCMSLSVCGSTTMAMNII